MTATLDPATRRLDDLPSPRGLPLLGNLHQLDVRRMHRVLEDWCAELGWPYVVGLGGKTRAYVSADPDLLQAVLRDRPHGFRRISSIESVLAEIGANGVFSVEGDAWLPQRRLVMQALAPTHFRSFFPTLQAITGRLHQRWRRAAERGDAVEMTLDLRRYTVDVTTALAFGEDPNTLEQDGNLIQDHLAYVFPMLESRTNAPFPWWRYVRLPSDRRFDRAMAAVHRHVGALIERARRRMRERPGEAPRNLLESLLAARDEGSGLDDAQVAANVMTLLLAGEETTANLLSWTMWYLGTQPAWQAALQAAAHEVLGEAAACSAYEDLRRLDVFEATANEAARLRPVAPLLFFEPLADVVLGGVAVPAGTPLFFVLRPAMLDDARFAGASQFRPERWAAGHGAGAPAHDARAFMQFGAGPRVCPGRHLAGVEVRLVLSMLARNFSLELAVDPASIREVMAFTMTPSAMPVRLTALRP